MNRIFTVLTAEFFLDWMPNGGKAVLLRTTFIAAYLYLLLIGMKSGTNPHAILEFSLEQFLSEVNGTLPWLGAIYGGVYVALYSRFASQWSYLAEVYNQQVQASVTLSETELKSEQFAVWQAAFIEDAVCMHLATKRGFSNAILMMLQEPETRKILEEDEHYGIENVMKIEARIRDSVARPM